MEYTRLLNTKSAGVLVNNRELLSRDASRPMVGCVAQLVERRSLTGELPCPALDLQLMGDHLCG